LVLLARSGIDNAELLASIIARRVLTSIAYDSLKNSFFYRIEDDNKRATIKNEFDKVLRAVAEPATQKIDDALKVLGIRRFQTEIKKILVQPD
jgi:trans-2-enoyl-CoA reductase